MHRVSEFVVAVITSCLVCGVLVTMTRGAQASGLPLLVINRAIELDNSTPPRPEAKRPSFGGGGGQLVAATKGGQLLPDTLVAGIQKGRYGTPERAGWFVSSVDSAQRSGWVPAGAVTPFEFRVKEVVARSVSIQHAGSLSTNGAKVPTGGGEPNIPVLIDLQDDAAVRLAWSEVSVAIRENDKLASGERMPEPYLARAEIWTSAGNYSDALQDYLSAIELIRQSDRDMTTYARYWEKLSEVAKLLQSSPTAGLGAQPNVKLAAMQHYGQGATKFFSGDYQGAIVNLDNAVQLAPGEPHAWYLRALAHRSLGDLAHAQYDAMMGAFFERRRGGYYVSSVNDQLSRVQGSSRTWLEAFRLGSINSNHLGTSDARFTTLGISR